MEFFNNPIANMYGPHFIVLYLALCTGAVWGLWFWVREGLAKKMYKGETMAMPLEHQPLELIFLSGGRKQLLGLVLLNLVERKWIKISIEPGTGRVLLQSKATATTNSVLAIEQQIIDMLKEQRYMERFVPRLYGSEEFRAFAGSLQKKLEGEGLMCGNSEKRIFNRWKGIILCLLTGLGIYKLVAAIKHGHHNVFFLIISMIVLSVVVFFINVEEYRTERAVQLLKTYKKAFSPIRGNKLLRQAFAIRELTLAIYGFGLLDGSAYHNFMRHIDSSFLGGQNQQGNSGGDNSGVSSSGGCSSCGDGGGCGGGCGGCGGCGS